MRIQQAFVDALIEEAFEEIMAHPEEAENQSTITVLKRWVEEMEYDRPRNRAEKILFEHLEAAIDRQAQHIKNLQPV